MALKPHLKTPVWILHFLFCYRTNISALSAGTIINVIYPHFKYCMLAFLFFSVEWFKKKNNKSHTSNDITPKENNRQQTGYL